MRHGAWDRRVAWLCAWGLLGQPRVPELFGLLGLPWLPVLLGPPVLLGLRVLLELARLLGLPGLLGLLGLLELHVLRVAVPVCWALLGPRGRSWLLPVGHGCCYWLRLGAFGRNPLDSAPLLYEVAFLSNEERVQLQHLEVGRGWRCGGSKSLTTGAVGRVNASASHVAYAMGIAIASCFGCSRMASRLLSRRRFRHAISFSATFPCDEKVPPSNRLNL